MTAPGFYHCSVKGVGRANGRSVVAAAAYRSGQRLEDERTGEVFDYRARGGVADTFILARADAPAWAQDRANLWNGAEKAEPRPNGRLATEFELALPHELTATQRKDLVRDFLAPIIARHGVAADVAIHAPGEGRDHRNIHTHVLLTHRELGPDGFGEIANARTMTRKRKGELVQEKVAGIAATPADIRAIRQEWEQHVNRAYERAGLDIRVDHRSHKDRGLEHEPTKHLGPAAAGMEQRGEESDRGNVNRDIEDRNAALRERAAYEVAARKAGADLAAAKMLADMERQFAAGAAHATEPPAPVHDRDAAEVAWQKELIDRAAAQAEHEARAGAQGRKDDTRGPPEARQPSEPAAGIEKHGGAAEPAQAVPPAAGRESGAASELAATAEAAADRGMHVGEGLLRGLGKLFSSFINWLADSIAPPPPPTRDQAERMAQSAEEQATDRAWREAAARQQAEHEFLLREIERSRQSADQVQAPTAAELYGTPRPRTQERDNERERDRGLEL